ncbi:Golgi apparatus membrane protein TVP18 [Spathaspora sp. JA1]|nr:Golgi apparatus membrane protein TVP18 [Spathaspora sp. JA1]
MAISVGSIFSNIFGGLSKDFQKKNFSLYGQWNSIFTIFLCLALGVANIFHFNLVIIFSIICLVQGLIVVFVEMPFLLKICPLTDTFVNFVKRFDDNLPRCGFYLLNAVIQWLSLTLQATSLIVVAVFFTVSSACYALAYFMHQEFMKSSLDVTGRGSNGDLEGQIGEHVVRNVL